jgi:hypothetical protein
MNKLYRLFTLSLVALLGLSLTGCGTKDDLDTNPYNRSGINIVAFGPSPILRTHEIHITGTNLGSVSEVLFAGKVPVARSAFNKADDQNIYVNVPDESLAGKIRLLVGTDTVATSITPLTFEEPIEITSVSPTEGLSAGDEVTVKGDYLYNIYQAIFTCGVTGSPINVEDFTYVSRREIRFIVPLDAESGVITFTDGAEWEEEFKTPLEIIPGTYESLSTTTSDFGQQITISGFNLHTIETVMFPGGVMAPFTVSDDAKTLTTTIPEETKSGAITLVLYSGASITTDELQLPELQINEEKFTDVKVGDVITLTGLNFDRIKSITLPGYGDLAPEEYTISGNELVFIVPEDMSDGNIVITQNSFISKTVKVMMYSDAPEVAIWAGEFVCSSWNGNQELAWGGFDWSTVSAGSKVRFYYKKNTAGAWGCISLRHGDSWGALPAPIPGQYDLSDDEGVLEVTFTAEVLADIIANGGLVITGDNYTLSKVAIPIPETVIWAGEFVCSSWNGNQDMAWGGFDWTTIAANSTISFTYKKNTAGAWGCISLRHGDSWGALPDPIPGQYDLSDDAGVLEVKFTQGVLDDIIANGGLVVTGDNYTLTRVTAK